MTVDTRKKPEEATIEELIADLCSCEDVDTALVVAPGCPWDGGGVSVWGYDMHSDLASSASTLREALIDFGRKINAKYPRLLKEDEEDGFYDLNWH